MFELGTYAPDYLQTTRLIETAQTATQQQCAKAALELVNEAEEDLLRKTTTDPQRAQITASAQALRDLIKAGMLWEGTIPGFAERFSAKLREFRELGTLRATSEATHARTTEAMRGALAGIAQKVGEVSTGMKIGAVSGAVLGGPVRQLVWTHLEMRAGNAAMAAVATQKSAQATFNAAVDAVQAAESTVARALQKLNALTQNALKGGPTLEKIGSVFVPEGFGVQLGETAAAREGLTRATAALTQAKVEQNAAAAALTAAGELVQSTGQQLTHASGKLGVAQAVKGALKGVVLGAGGGAGLQLLLGATEAH